MPVQSYPISTTIRFKITLTRTTDSSLVDPPDLILRLLPPEDAAVVQFKLSDSPSQVVRESAGVYHCDYTPETSGRWRYAWQAVGNPSINSADTIFYIQESDLFP